MFIPNLKVVFIHAKRHRRRQNRWAIAPILQGKLNMRNLPCKTVQDYPARLHASYCTTLQRVGYLAMCCMQGVARHLARRPLNSGFLPDRPLSSTYDAEACVFKNNATTIRVLATKTKN